MIPFEARQNGTLRARNMRQIIGFVVDSARSCGLSEKACHFGAGRRSYSRISHAVAALAVCSGLG
jgi:hypothetical protein